VREPLVERLVRAIVLHRRDQPSAGRRSRDAPRELDPLR
jgi:hypothetical protein